MDGTRTRRVRFTKTKDSSASTAREGGSCSVSSTSRGSSTNTCRTQNRRRRSSYLRRNRFENIPAGWRARETYVVHGPDEFEEIFELAEAGSPFELYSTRTIETCPVAEGLSGSI